MNIKKIVLILAVLGLAIGAGFIFKDEILSLVKPVSAEEIYPMFFCPCCGQPLDKNNICCAQAQERIDYIDSLTAQNLNLSEKEIILTYIKKYGLNAFIDQDKQAEAKAWLASFREASISISLEEALFMALAAALSFSRRRASSPVWLSP